MHVTATTWALGAAIALMRLAGFATFAPVLSSKEFGYRLRFFFCVVTAVAVSPRVGNVANLPSDVLPQVILLAGEFAIGAVIGFCAKVVLCGIEIAALQISQQMGISIGELYNPVHSEAGGALRQFYYLLALVVFMAVGGMGKLFEVLFKTFEIIPPSGLFKADSVLAVTTGLLGLSFLMALKIAAPLIIALLLATVAMGMLQRMLPQINIITVGFTLRMILGLIVLAISLSVLAGVVEVGFEKLIAVMKAVE